MGDQRSDGSRISYEEAMNRAYITSLEERFRRPVGVAVSRNEVWLNGLPTFGSAADGSVHPLVARVALDAGDSAVPRTFYIGPRHHTWDGKECFSWAAPVAEVFFKPNMTSYPLADRVVAHRTFSHVVQRIVDMREDRLREYAGEPFEADTLTVPKAPGGPRRRHVRGESSIGDGRVDAPGDQASARISQDASVERPVPGPSLVMMDGMRAPELVLERLAKPRTHRLTTVLSTLQPDQYALVSRDSDVPLLVQGHPGTGKTIVAVYRAAYLVDEKREGGPLDRVLLVGPTQEYVSHVAGLLGPLVDPGRLRVTSMDAFMREAARIKDVGSGGTMDGTSDDVDAEARGFTDLAARLADQEKLLKTGRGAQNANRKQVYEMLRANGLPGRPLDRDPAKIAWMRKLPPYEQAVGRRRYLPLLAQCSLSISPPPPTDRFDHIIVDEAQDMTPIEWNVLDLFNRNGHWTLVGDMNQRRADASYSAWSQIADHLTLGEDVGSVRETVIERGYRSTQAILRFADRLLPRDLRGAQSLQVHGDDPTVVHVASKKPEALALGAVKLATDFVHKYSTGTVSVISLDPGALLNVLHKRGWRRDGREGQRWSLDEQHISVHVPESARGLEFDAVVVVEPALFPRNLGRSGQLYTSLTRANRELALIYHRPLPDELRHAGRRS